MFEKFNDGMIAKRVPKWIVNRTRENMENYNMDLYDAFDEAVRNYPRKLSKKLWAAWYFSNYREYIPSAYFPNYIEFKRL